MLVKGANWSKQCTSSTTSLKLFAFNLASTKTVHSQPAPVIMIPFNADDIR